jgi:hypothetical protein
MKLRFENGDNVVLRTVRELGDTPSTDTAIECAAIVVAAVGPTCRISVRIGERLGSPSAWQFDRLSGRRVGPALEGVAYAAIRNAKVAARVVTEGATA